MVASDQVAMTIPRDCGLVFPRPQRSRPRSANPITFKRQVGNAPRFAAQGVKVVPIHAAPEPSYWMYRRCSPGARAADPYTVCFPSNTVRPYLGRDPDANVRLQMRRDYLRDNFPASQ